MFTILLALIQNIETAPGVEEGISAGALGFMLISMGLVISLTIWCFSKVLRTKEHFDPDGTGPARSPVPGQEDPRRKI